MSKAIQFFALAGFAGLVAACNNRDEFVVVVPEPVLVEPTFSGTYG